MLSISVRTVETHRAHLVRKLGLKTRAEIVRYALATGQLEAPAAAACATGLRRRRSGESRCGTPDPRGRDACRGVDARSAASDVGWQVR